MAEKATSHGVPALLKEYGAIIRQALHQYLSNSRPRRYLYDLVADYPLRAGKMMRPSICLAAARAFGGSLEQAVPTAVAIELLHNALLIHDDIEDGSETRRGKPALHALHGVPLALNAGDLLMLTSLQPLTNNWQLLGPNLALRLFEETQRMARESAEGQAMELGWRETGNGHVRAADYLEMVLKKTCWLATIFPLRAGALIGSGGQIDPEPLIRLGFFLGAAFQIRDDVLNLQPGKRYGKEINGDLLEGKRTLMLIRLLQVGTPTERAKLSRILSAQRPQRTRDQVNWMLKLIAKYDCIEYANRIAQELAGAALHEASRVLAGLPDSRDKQFLQEMAVWVINRE